MMTENRGRRILIAGVIALLVTLTVLAAQIGASSSLYVGKDSQSAASALLQVAEAQAGDGSWELIAVGRVYYLSGDKQRGQALFDRATAKKTAESDLRRIADVYNEAKDHDKAIAALEKAVAMSPKESKLLAELGAAYNLKGDRKKAEEMFARAFARDPEEFWNTVNVAGSYLGVRPD